MSFMPQVASATDMQRNYKSIFSKAKQSPVVILTNNEPECAIVDMSILEELTQLRRLKKEQELRQALKAIRAAKTAEDAGKLIHGDLATLLV